MFFDLLKGKQPTHFHVKFDVYRQIKLLLRSFRRTIIIRE